ncbi:MAG: phage tail protein [Pseudomonadota bacterium]
MATERANRPYAGMNYRVKIGDSDENAAIAGFSEVSGLGLDVSVAEYRAGNAPTNEPVKVPSVVKVPDVTLKRGVIGELELLHEWVDALRNGDESARRNVTIELLSEDRSTVAQTWRLFNAMIMSYKGPSLTGTSADIAIEEVTLTSESIQMS